MTASPPTTQLTARAQFATASRLVCALVNEAFTPAVLVSGQWAVLVPSAAADKVDHAAIAAALSTAPPSSSSVASESDSAQVIAIAAKLAHQPLLSASDESSPLRIRAVDPDDLDLESPFVLIHTTAAGPTTTSATRDPVTLWTLVAKWTNQSQDTTATVASELASSALVQSYLYSLAPATPPTLKSSALDWEHAVLEGHATHPMHRTRSATSPLTFDPASDLAGLAFPDLRFIQVPRSAVHAHGTWLSEVHPHLETYLNVTCPASDVLVPIHAMQVPWIKAQFPTFRILAAPAATVKAGAQASTRSVVPLDPAFALGHHVKLPICLTITSAMRIITPFSIHNGPVMSAIATLANQGNPVLTPVVEPATIGLSPEAFPLALAKTVGCILRMNPESSLPATQRTIICASLVEKDLATSTPHVVRAFALDTPAKRHAWFAQYVRVLLAGILPPLVRFGYAWEAHGQNMLVRVDVESGEVVGFAARDFGGCQVYAPKWVEAHAGNVDAQRLVEQLMPGSLQIGESEVAGFKIVYHTLFACHLHRLARALGVHRDGSGWRLVRAEIKRHVPRGSDLWRAWMETDEVPAKALLRMKCDGKFRDYVYEKVPNVVLTGLVGRVEDEE